MTKLTLVSIYKDGERFSAFVNLPVEQDGKVRMSITKIFNVVGLKGIPYRTPFSIGQ